MHQCIVKRFWSKVVIGKDDECWEWLGSVDAQGRARFSIYKIPVNAARVMYQLTIGDIPEGLCVLHTCDNRGCINPYHLYAGTNQDNVNDRNRKGRQAKGEKSGVAKLTEDIVREIVVLLKEGKTYKEIADRFNTTDERVHYIATGKAWVHITGGVICKRSRSRLNKEEVLAIKELLKQNVSYKEITKKFNISVGTVGNIKRGIIWKNIN